MYIPKRYGQSRINKCPFCGRDAFSQNSQKIPVCNEHKDNMLKDMKCACGSWLDMREGKYGVFYTCLSCGPVNMNKALEINNANENKDLPYKIQRPKSTSQAAEQKRETEERIKIEEQKINQNPYSQILKKIQPEKKKETTIRSDELDFM